MKGLHYQTGEPISLSIKNGIISDIQKIQSDDRSSLPLIGPGLVDLQVNGHGGKDLNSTEPLEADVATDLTRLLWQEGVTSYLPTVITNSDALIERAMHSISKACSHDEEVNASVAGIHLEGPFISPEDGARGAHKAEFVRE